MLIAALLLFLSEMFGGGGDSLLLDVHKPLKQYVKDPVRVEKLLAINKSMQSQAELLSKEFEAQRKHLIELQKRRQTTEAEFAAAVAIVDEKRSAFRAHIVAARFAMKDLMTADEWANVYAVEAGAKP